MGVKFFYSGPRLISPLSLGTSCPWWSADSLRGDRHVLWARSAFDEKFVAWEPAMDDELRLRFNMMKNVDFG